MILKDPYIPRNEEDYVLYKEDCLETSRRIPDESVDLIYADPPFLTGRLHSLNGYNFDDRWSGYEEYIDWIRARLAEFRRILKSTGSIYIHCDWHISHYLKVLADTIFHSRNFLNEIIWKRQSSHNDSKQGSRHFGRIHDTILVYAKSHKYQWNQQFSPYGDSYIRRTYRHVEPETGRKYALGDLTGPGGKAKGNPRYKFLGIVRYWRYSKSKMHELFRKGRIVHKKGRVPLLKRYLDEMSGKPIQDLWIDIKPCHNTKVLYPTQKPKALLERIIRTSSCPGHIVYDPFAGSGTSGLVCYEMSRKWIASEISSEVCDMILSRLQNCGCPIMLYDELHPTPLATGIMIEKTAWSISGRVK